MLEDDIQELGGGDFVAGLEDLGDGDIGHFVDEFGGGLGLSFGAFEEGLVIQVVLVAAFSPVGQVLVVEACGLRAEVFKDGVILAAFVQEMVDSLADWFGQASDLSGARAAGGAVLEGGEYGVG